MTTTVGSPGHFRRNFRLTSNSFKSDGYDKSQDLAETSIHSGAFHAHGDVPQAVFAL